MIDSGIEQRPERIQYRFHRGLIRGTGNIPRFPGLIGKTQSHQLRIIGIDTRRLRIETDLLLLL